MPETSELDRPRQGTGVQLSPGAAVAPPDPSRAVQRVIEAPLVPDLRSGRHPADAAPVRRRVPAIPLSAVLVVALPTVLAGLYFGVVASPSYVAEFRATVRSVQPAVEASGVTALLGMAGASQATNDANAVVQYLQSRDALEDIDKAIGLRAGYEARGVDWFSRLKEGNTVEGFLRFWRRQLDAYFETTTGTIVVRVAAFTPHAALQASQTALTLSEDLVNRLSIRTRDDTVQFAEQAVSEAEARLMAANERLRIVQDQERILDPQKLAASTLGLSAKLKDQLASLSSTLAVQRSYMASGSPMVRITEDQIAALQKEIEKIDASTTESGDKTGRPLSGVLGTFERAETERSFAEKSYSGALAAVQNARLEASRKQVYLATIVRPELPQEPDFPKPLANTATVFGVALLAWLIGLLSFFAIKEHV